MKIIKRDGTKEKFDQNKIIDAVLAAFQEVDGNLSDYAYIKAGNIADFIQEVAEEKSLTVEDIQDMVEKGLMSTKRKDVAKAFIVYRDERTKARNKKSVLIKEIGEKLMAKNVQNQNANVDEYSFGGRKGEASNALMKQYALDYCMSKMARENHLNNIIYTHDLDSYALGMHNCCARETKFITRDYGVQSFENYNDGDTVIVLNHDGGFNNATVKRFGIQKLNKVTFSF